MSTYLQTVTSIRLPVNHIQNLILHGLAHRVPRRPIVSRASTLLVHIEVLRVVDVAVRAIDNAVDDSRLEI
jgi:hypothetical protein